MSPSPPGLPSDARLFWNRKAETFPRYSPGEDTYEAGVLALAEANGALFAGARLLDVGCGSGLYTLRLAQLAHSVTAVDFSESMLKILREDAEKLNLHNLEILHSDWLSVELFGAYDVVFCSMCPAMALEGGLDKLVALRQAQIVYLGWNGLARSDVMAGLYERFQIVPKKFDSASRTRAWLTARNVEFRSVPVEGTWRVYFSQESLLASVLVNLDDYGVKPRLAELTSYLEKFREPAGQFLETTDYKIQMLLWRNH